MERNNNNNNLSNNMKDHSLGGKSNNYYYYNNNKAAIKSPWEYSSSSNNPSFADDYMGNGFSWPPRSYICSFCKREFRSAQALGGHMNVHRRDRARLRSVQQQQQQQSPPREDINLNLNPILASPNPNPNFLATPPPSTRLHHPSYTTTCTLPSLVSPSLSSSSSASASHHEIKKSAAAAAADGALLRNLSPKGSDLMRTKAMKSLFGVKEFDGFTQAARDCDVLMKKADFVGLELGIGLHSDLKEDHVDLELRLGYS